MKQKNKKNKVSKKALNKQTVALKRSFRENPIVEEFYKTIYEFDLREEAYVSSIEAYLKLKGK